MGMRYGRKTCASPLKNDKVQPLPGGDDPQAVDATRFMMGLTVEETAALLGNIKIVHMFLSSSVNYPFFCT